MSKQPWHKRYHSDALSGYINLTLEERGAYTTLLDLMYDRGGPLDLNERLLAGYLNVSIRKAKSVLHSLIEKGKITVTPEGYLSNRRAEIELEKSAKTSRECSENGSEGGRKRAENAKLSNEINETAQASLKQTSSHIRDQKPELEKDTPIGVSDPPSETITPTPPDAKAIEAEVHRVAVETYNAMAKAYGLPLVAKLTDQRKKALRARLKDCGGIVGWQVALKKVSESSFLTGDNHNGWKADFDFLMQQSSFTKLMEGSYDRRKSAGNADRYTLHDAARELHERIAGGGGEGF